MCIYDFLRFILGNLVKTLIHTQVTRYLEFQKCKGAYVVKKNKILKVWMLTTCNNHPPYHRCQLRKVKPSKHL